METVLQNMNLFLPFTEMDDLIMQVQVIHEDPVGGKTEFGIQELEHMPPLEEPFSVDKQVYYRAKAYFGPDENGLYLLILHGEPKLVC